LRIKKTLAKTLLDAGKMTLAQYNQMIKDLNAIAARKTKEVDKQEKEDNKKKADAAAKTAADKHKAAVEAQKKT